MNTKALICVNTSERPTTLKATVWEYLRFCKKNANYDFVVSLDGDDHQTVALCKRYGIPLITSEVREGVGIAKNRVIKSYPDYEYYFFIEDDAFLLDEAVFNIHIEAARELGIPHMSLGPSDRFVDRRAARDTNYGPLGYYSYGSALFNFFTREGLEKVGGFHPMFAALRRFGHTEHSCRFVNQGLAVAPFCVLEKCLVGYVKAYSPRSVTRVKVERTENRLFSGENELIEKKLEFVPIETPAVFFCPDSLSLDEATIPRFPLLHRFPFLIHMGILDAGRMAKNAFLQICGR